jgi:hypothetical protein
MSMEQQLSTVVLALDFGHIQQREDHWAIVDLKGKAGHTRTVPMPGWVKALIDEWLEAAKLTTGKLFRRVNKNGKAWGKSLTAKAVWHVVREYACKAHQEACASRSQKDMCPALSCCRWRTRANSVSAGARFHSDDGRYLGCKQRIRAAVNDRIGIEPEG